MGFRTKQYGAFIPPVAGNVLTEKCFQISVGNPTEDFWIRASELDPVLLYIQPWVVSDMNAGSLLVGTADNDDEYIEAGDIDETSEGAGTAKIFRLTADTHIYIAFAQVEFATGTLTFTDVGVADQTITIGDVTYTWKATVSAANEVDIGADAAGCAANIAAAINAGAGAGTIYGTGTVANPKASAVDNLDGTVTITALIANDNTIPTTETGTNTSFAAVTLVGASLTSGQIDLFIQA